MIFASLEEAQKGIENLEEKDVPKVEGWTPYHTLVHCAQTIAFSMEGYPEMKPAIIRGTIGKLALHVFLKKGAMRHNLTADVPGLAWKEQEGTFQEGKKILGQSISDFLQYKGELKPHLLFGNMSFSEYNRYFAMHLTDHLSSREV